VHVLQAVEELRNRGLAVVGLWNINHLPNFPDGTTFNPKSTLGTRPVTYYIYITSSNGQSLFFLNQIGARMFCVGINWKQLQQERMILDTGKCVWVSGKWSPDCTG
jgi:hypothetical protein